MPGLPPRSSRRFTVDLPRPFDLSLTVESHGWYDLAPFEWVPESRSFSTALLVGRRTADLLVQQRGPHLHARLTCAGPPRPPEMKAARRTVVRMLRLDEDLRPFWKLCSQDPTFAWVAHRGAGRILRAPTLFEDLLKLLFTTNCTWAATRGMVERFVEAAGTRSPSGRRAFPSPAATARRSPDWFRAVVHAGYRSSAAHHLARWSGSRDPAELESARLTTEALRRRFLDLPGFGPYAAGHALRLLGRHSDLAIDSWCRARIARLLERRKPPSDRQIEQRYRRFGEWAGLAFWMELTGDRHAGSGD